MSYETVELHTWIHLCRLYLVTLRLQAKASVTCLTWTPEGRRCISGSQRGEFTLWGGTNFSYEAALQVWTVDATHVSPLCQHHTSDSVAFFRMALRQGLSFELLKLICQADYMVYKPAQS